MIIKALYEYYDRLLADDDSGVSLPGYSRAKVSFALLLSGTGDLLGVVDLRVEKGKKFIQREMNVPEQVKKSSGVSANFLCETSKYILGLDLKDKKERVKKAHEACVQLHEEILGEVKDPGAEAVLNFLRNWNVENVAKHPKIVEAMDGMLEGGNLVFRLDRDEKYIHERTELMQAWSKYHLGQSSEISGQCLITGQNSPIARLHPNIKGVVGAQSSGASLVSFNKDSFTSYGKEQSYNAWISENATFGYTTALNWLIGSEKHRMRIGDTTTVFWAERSTNGLEEDLLGALFYPAREGDKKGEDEQRQVTRDPQTVKLVHDIFAKVRKGELVKQELTGVDADVKFYILGLAPNASRLSVRFWHVERFGNVIYKIAQHYDDMKIVKSYANEPDFISIGTILKESAPLGDAKRISPLLGGVVMRAILTGMPYPQTLLHSILLRIRADQTVNYVRAAIIKACLLRNIRYKTKEREVDIAMALDEQNPSVAYRLGRLFALLEKAQQDANPGLNATIKDRYFGSASATPRSVFPILLRLTQHHIAKAEYGRSMDKRIEEVMGGIDSFPSHLNLEKQGLFVLGYYHQRKALYTKNESKEV
ncbi:type I-C CRISPR-associated protein Cas8c/Csd1 [Desulfosporosinus metallidurans]|uniref:CRISPR-associated protein, Csd1 family n=1 Tax=Desulfosporosinus metallidurans TaxID=1888891 RepID=A0A1Q8QMH2_9FIRM|nr:type I-C CRISPR-associated protein Cas8c/Csd1 [Desulfosporosinus metallidurans]OLN28492.1 CRISPR-associated protein, Csd1 family [Desulfosporosinus metallidurans]